MAVTASREPAVSPPGALPFPPRALRYTRGGNVSMAVEFNGTEVRHRSVGGFGPQQGKVFSEGTAAPSAETWQRVHALLDEAGAWTWSATYSSAASRQTDGVGWELWINGADDRVFHARGYNAAPPNLNDVERALAALYAPP